MSQVLSLGTQVCLLCCHPAPADHFAEFSQVFDQEHISYQIVATEKAYEKLHDRKVAVQQFRSPSEKTIKELPEESAEELAQQVAKICSLSKVVIADVGADFTARVFRQLSENYPDVLRVAYYENPENYVKGGYSDSVQKIINHAQTILFANANLVEGPLYYSEFKTEINLNGKKQVALGYSSLPKEAIALNEKREKGITERRGALFESLGLKDKGQKIAIYIGGANETYYRQAFPHFLQILKETAKSKRLENMIFVLQQHPRARDEGNLDMQQLDQWKAQLGETAPQFFCSPLKSSDEALLIADVSFYYQTMGNTKSKLLVPTIQVGHERYEDTLVKKGICPSVVDAENFVKELEDALVKPQEVDASFLFDAVGYKEDWSNRLLDLVRKREI